MLDPSELQASVRMTRKELYEAVWNEPMQRLAGRLGLSDVALAKRCHGLNIPVPPRGFWARKAAGQKVRNTPLPQATASQAVAVSVFDPRPDTPPSAEPQEGPVWEQQQFEAQPENKIEVRERLSRHPLIQTATLVHRAKADTHEIDAAIAKHGLISISTTKTQFMRALRFMDAFIGACELRGFEVVGWRRNGPDSHVVVLGQKIEVRLREPDRRIELVRDPKAPPPPPFSLEPRYRFEGTGLLEVSFGHRYALERRSWKDGKRVRIENSLHDMMVTLVSIAVALRDREEERVIAEQRRFEAAERARVEQKRRELEQKRLEQLVGDVRSWRLAEDIRAFLVEIEERSLPAGGVAEADPTLASWIGWARSVADRADPLRQPELVGFLQREPTPTYR